MSVQLRSAPRPVFCVVEHACRDRAVAESVCAGRFTHLGLTLELGVEPDWLGACLPEDKEWRIEWSKFYYGLDLAAAFQASGDPRFLTAWERLVRSWIRQVPTGFDRSDVAGRRVQNWIYAWIRFEAAPAFPGWRGGFADELLASLTAQTEHLRTHLTAERNHRTLELYALFIAALALPEVDRTGDLLDFAVAELHRNLGEDIRPDGVHREASTHYHMIALRSYLGVRENARLFDLELPAGYDDRLERACDFALHCHRPDGGIPALSDSDSGSYGELLALAGSLLGRADLRYAATAGGEGSPPVRRYVSFPDGGYYVQRSGWGSSVTPYRDERYLILDCGPLGDGGHGHYDLLSVEIAAGGRPLIVDPGRFTYSDAPPDWRRRFKGTAAHNTITVDGLDQTPYRRGRPKGPTAQGRLLRRVGAPGLDLLQGEVMSPAYDAVHSRRVVFVADQYWLIVDRLRAERPHRYDLRFHLSAAAEGRTTWQTCEGNTVVRAPGLTLVFAPARGAEIEGGWVSPSYGTKLPAPVVRVEAGGDTAEFLTLVLPWSVGAVAPKLRPVEAGPASSSSNMVEVAGVGPDGTSRDLLVWSNQAEWLELGRLRCRARLGWMRQSAAGVPLTIRACEVSDALWLQGSEWVPLLGAEAGQWVGWDAEAGLSLGATEPL